MYAYAARRLMLAIPTLIGASLVIFAVMRVLPGDVIGAIYGDTPLRPQDAQAIKRQLHLDRPLPAQYLDWLSGIVRFDLGRSLVSQKSVGGQLKRFYPVTLELAIGSMLLSLALALPIGTVTALRQDTAADYIGRGVIVVALGMPSFWLAILLILVLSRLFSWLPPIAYASFTSNPRSNVSQFAWPVLVLGVSHSAVLARVMRSQVLEVMREDYVRTARAKGLKSLTVIRRHILKNALIPVVTLAGLQLGALLGGTVVIERVFNLPGLGTYLVESIQNRDYPVVQLLVFVAAVAYIALNLVVDVAYTALDPRIRYG